MNTLKLRMGKNMLKKLDPKLEKEFLRMEKKIDRFCNRNFKDKEVVWKEGPYKERRALIKGVSWFVDYYDPSRFVVSVIAQTEKKDGTGYLKGRGYFGRRHYLELYEWFRPLKKGE